MDVNQSKNPLDKKNLKATLKEKGSKMRKNYILFIAYLVLILSSCSVWAGGTIFGHSKSSNTNGVSSIGIHICGSLTCPDVIIQQGNCDNIEHATMKYGLCVCDEGYIVKDRECISRNFLCFNKPENSICDYTEKDSEDGLCIGGVCKKAQKVCRWSDWYDSTHPEPGLDGGDFETYDNLRQNGYSICQSPEDIECRAQLLPGIPLENLGQTVSCNIDTGLICYNKEQSPPLCLNYKLRVLCCEHELVCKEGEYLSGTECLTCPIHAKYCDSNGPVCKAGYYLSKGQCLACDGEKEYSFEGATECSICDTKVSDNHTKCPAPIAFECDTGYYYDGPTPLYEDNLDEAKCSLCDENSILKEQCQNICPEGNFAQRSLEGNISCIPCPENSVFCKDFVLTCSKGCERVGDSCLPKENVFICGSDYAVCDDGYYWDEFNDSCVKAENVCQIPWLSVEHMVGCENGTIICENGYFYHSDAANIPGQCLECPTENVMSCDENGVVCKEGYIFNGTGCECNSCHWTEWFDVDYPEYEEGGGDFETYEKIRAAGGTVCKQPQEIECEAENYPGLTPEQVGQQVHCDVRFGLVCRNDEQLGLFKMCYNYRMRVLCCDCSNVSS